jgi:hypothetical protein
MIAALEDFGDYMEYLATGKLDGYLDSIRRENKVTDLDLGLPRNPILLIHELGRHQDPERIRELFVHDTVFVTSG